MAEKKYQYKVTLHQKGKQPVEYFTETLELAEELVNLYTTMQKRYGVEKSELYAELEKLNEI